MTACERTFAVAVNDTTSGHPRTVKAWSTAAPAASVAKPWPQCAAARRQPTSTFGENAASKRTGHSPV